MAKGNNTLSYREWYWCDRWEGTADQLISAGIVERHLLPGEPGRNKTSVTYNGGRNQYTKRGENYLQIQKISKSRYRVEKGLCEAEADRRKNLKDEEHRKWLEKHDAEMFVKRVMNEFVESEEVFKNKASELIQYLTFYLRYFLDGRLSGGYLIDTQSSAKIDHFLSEIKRVFSKTKVTFDKSLRLGMIETLNDYKNDPSSVLKVVEEMKALEIKKHKRPVLQLVPHA